VEAVSSILRAGYGHMFGLACGPALHVSSEHVFVTRHRKIVTRLSYHGAARPEKLVKVRVTL